MNEEVRRRSSDPQPDDSIITKAAKMELGGPVLDKVIRVVLLVLVSGGTSSLVGEKKGVEVTNLQTQLQEARNDLAEVKADQLRKWTGYYRNVRNQLDDDLCYERRFSRVEARLGIEAPACGAPSGEEAAAPPQERPDANQ